MTSTNMKCSYSPPNTDFSKLLQMNKHSKLYTPSNHRGKLLHTTAPSNLLLNSLTLSYCMHKIHKTPRTKESCGNTKYTKYTNTQTHKLELQCFTNKLISKYFIQGFIRVFITWNILQISQINNNHCAIYYPKLSQTPVIKVWLLITRLQNLLT